MNYLQCDQRNKSFNHYQLDLANIEPKATLSNRLAAGDTEMAIPGNILGAAANYGAVFCLRYRRIANYLLHTRSHVDLAPDN